MLDLLLLGTLEEMNQEFENPCFLTCCPEKTPPLEDDRGHSLGGFSKLAGETTWPLTCSPGFLLLWVGVRLSQRCLIWCSTVDNLQAHKQTAGISSCMWTWMCKCSQTVCRSLCPHSSQDHLLHLAKRILILSSAWA